MNSYQLSYGVRFKELEIKNDIMTCIPVITLNGEDIKELNEIHTHSGDILTIHKIVDFKFIENLIKE